MANKGGDDEHKMLFDIRGRRKNVVKVVYAILALLMGASLILFLGPGVFGVGGPGDAGNPAEASEERAERLEVKLKKEPDNPDLLLALTRAQISAGTSLAEQNPETGEIAITTEARQQWEKASESWSEYLEATDEPTAGAAQLMANTLFSLAQTSRSSREAKVNIEAAVDAQQIVADDRPSIGALSTLSLYKLFEFDYAGAEADNEAAKKLASSKFQEKQLDNQFKEITKNAKAFEETLEKEKKLNEEAKEGAAGTEGEQQNPLGGALGPSGGTTLGE